MKETKEDLKREIFYVHAQEDSILSRSKFFPT